MVERIEEMTRRKLLARGMALGGAAAMSPLANPLAQEVAGENAEASLLKELGAGLHGTLCGVASTIWMAARVPCRSAIRTEMAFLRSWHTTPNGRSAKAIAVSAGPPDRPMSTASFMPTAR